MSNPYESLSAEERVQYIQGLKIPDQAVIAELLAGTLGDAGSAPPRGFNAATSPDETAAVNAGASVSFVAHVEGQMKADILNSTLLAQLSASEQFNRQDQTFQWYDAYRDVLQHVGWILQDFHLVQLPDVKGYGSVDNLLNTRAAEYLSATELELFRTTVEALNTKPNESANRLFDNSAKYATKANFQIGVASDVSGDAAFKISFHSYTVSQNIEKVLFLKFGTLSVTFLAGKQVMLLKTGVYDTCREAVLQKLGQNATSLVMGIEI